jgi:hypothetical protein
MKRGALWGRPVVDRAGPAAAWGVLTVIAAGLLSACASVHVVTVDPAETAYKQAISPAMDALTRDAATPDDTCAGGKHPDANNCYRSTQIEIADAKTLRAILATVPVPGRYSRANTDLVTGLDLFIEGMTERNKALTDHSATEYSAAFDKVRHSIDLQKTAFAEYPPDANIRIS